MNPLACGRYAMTFPPIGRRKYPAPPPALALREFALGVEGLDCFVRPEPLRRVHECSFGVLALESEVLNPRL